MGVWKTVKGTFFKYKTHPQAIDAKKVIKNVDEKANWQFCIFGEKNIKKSAKRFYFVHFILKYKIYMPIFYLLESKLKKYKYKVTDEWYDKSLFIWDKCWDNASYEFRYICLNGGKDIESVYPDKKVREQFISDNISYCKKQPLAKLKDFMVLTFGNDTAYREWLNIFLYNLYKAKYDVMDMVVFNSLFDETTKEWRMKYAYHHTGMFFRTPEEKGLWQQRLNNAMEVSPITRIKDMLVSFMVEYPEYKIWLFLFMENLKKAVDEEFKDKKIHHLFYSSQEIDDVEYYNIGKDFFDNTFLHNLQDGSRVLVTKEDGKDGKSGNNDNIEKSPRTKRTDKKGDK